MEENKSKGYIYCSHCDNVVSRSTFQRHERKRYSASSMRKTALELSSETPCSSDSDSTMDDEGKLLIGSWMLLNICDWGSQVISDNNNIGFSTCTWKALHWRGSDARGHNYSRYSRTGKLNDMNSRSSKNVISSAWMNDRISQKLTF